MYTLKITLQYHDSYEESNWCASHSFNTERECYNYIEKNFASSDMLYVCYGEVIDIDVSEVKTNNYKE